MPIWISSPRLALLACIGSLALAACGSDAGPTTPGDPNDPNDPNLPGDPSLDCVAESYPCSFAEVPIAILERSISLGEQAAGMLRAGATTAATAAWLEGQQEMAEVNSDATAIRFRPEGGREIWIFTEEALGSPQADAGAADAVTGADAGAAPVPGGGAQSVPPGPAFEVVGPETQQKKALILAPYKWEYTIYDQSDAVGAILSATRGYEGGVTVVANTQQTSAAVNISSFQSWDEFQVVLLSTHGAVLCEESRCRAGLSPGRAAALLPAGPGSPAEKLRTLAAVGLSYHMGVQPGEGEILLTADFFRHEYPGGLDNTLVFLSACESFAPTATDIVDALRGNTSVVLGWDAQMYVDESFAAALALFGHLSEGGYTVQTAYEKLGGLRTGTAVPGLPAPDLRVSGRADGGDLRIRDIVTLLHPAGGQTLAAPVNVSIIGTANDGAPDRAPFRVRVDGVPENRAAGMMVTVAIDGVEHDPIPLTSGTIDDQDRWTVSGDLPLGYDLQSERAVNFRARVNLYDEGESEHVAGATLTGAQPPIMGTTWRFEATQTTFWIGDVPHTPYTATTTLTLTFAEGQDNAEPHPRYVVTGGSVTYDYNHTNYSCTYSAPVLNFDVTNENAGVSFLLFDTTVEPATYRAVMHTLGPTFQVTDSCGDSSSIRDHVANNTWLIMDPGETLPVSEDGTTMSGTYRVTNEFTTATFVVETNYMFVRMN